MTSIMNTTWLWDCCIFIMGIPIRRFHIHFGNFSSLLHYQGITNHLFFFVVVFLIRYISPNRCHCNWMCEFLMYSIPYSIWILIQYKDAILKIPSYQYRKFHCGDKTVIRSAYIHNETSYIGNMASLYWISALVLLHFSFCGFTASS